MLVLCAAVSADGAFTGADMAENAGQANRLGMLSLLPLALIALVMGFALFGDRGMFHYFQLNHQKSLLLEEVASVEQQNAELREKINALRSDRSTIERIARTELGMVREDELVFQFASEPASSSSAASTTPSR